MPEVRRPTTLYSFNSPSEGRVRRDEASEEKKNLLKEDKEVSKSPDVPNNSKEMCRPNAYVPKSKDRGTKL